MVPIISTKQGIEDDISGIIQKTIQSSMPNLKPIAANFFPNSIPDREEAIHDFFVEKIIGKSSDEIFKIREKGIGYLIVMFRNYCIDIKRKQNRDVINSRTKTIDAIAEQTLPFVEGETIDERIESIINGYKGMVEKEFSGIYAEIFELMARSYSTKEISEKLNIQPNNVDVAKHRIRKSLRCIAASILL